MTKRLLKRVGWLLQHLDGFWSVPLAFAIFWIAGLLINAFFGYGAGTYDPGFIQPLFLASGIVIGATNITIWGLYFTFRGMYRYIYGQPNPDKEKAASQPRINYSKIDWLKLTVWQRYIVVFSVFFFYFFSIILVYLKLV